jgi:hypothetical protein
MTGGQPRTQEQRKVDTLAKVAAPAADVWVATAAADAGRLVRMAHLRDIEDVPEFDRLEIRHFFEVYKSLEPGKEVETSAWADRATARSEIEACLQRAQRWASRVAESRLVGKPRLSILR